ncbi:MAG: metallophosphoesterase [Gaiella sp.]
MFVVGDVHGHRDVLAGLLRDAGLIGADDRWTGGDARLWLMGDLVDRGPDGLGAIELAMALEDEAGVRCLLGNHELFLLAVDRQPHAAMPRSTATYAEIWLGNGGQPSDLQGLEDAHRRWLAERPPVAREGDWLLLHADTDRYLDLGATVAEICAFSRAVLTTADPNGLATLVDVTCDRGRLVRADAVGGLLGALGGTRIVHGHTPIPVVLGVDPASVTAPLVSADGRVVNVDHCLFGGGPGFVVEL